MVVPPGEQTSSLRTSGCFPVSRTILAAPSTDCAASVMASLLGIPFRTPASAIASMNRYTKAGELPASPVMTSIFPSGISTASPTDSSTDLTRPLSSVVRVPSEEYPMAPSRTATQWLGMTLTILASGTYDLRALIVSPATTLRSSVPGLNLVPSSTITPAT